MTCVTCLGGSSRNMEHTVSSHSSFQYGKDSIRRETPKGRLGSLHRRRHIGSLCKHSQSYVLGLQQIVQLDPRTIQSSTTPAYLPPNNPCVAARSSRSSCKAFL